MDHPDSPTRRAWLRHSTAWATGLALGADARLSLAAAPVAQPQDKRLVLVILRGGLDGLAAVPAVGDPALMAARAALVPSGARPLDSLFALHPALAQLHTRYTAGELLVLQAVGLPYRDRSHFDAQQVLESGGQRPFELDSGWLGRALARQGGSGMAFQTAVPLVLRGHEGIDTWAPSRQAEPAADLVERLQRLYAQDAPLAGALARARDLRAHGLPEMAEAAPGMAAGPAPGAMPGAAGTAGTAGTTSTTGATGPAAAAGAASAAAQTGATPAAPRAGQAEQLARQAASFIARPNGPQAAVLEMGGWDSHAQQGADTGSLAANLQRMDAALAALHAGLSAPEAHGAWQRTLVLVVSEFGRTVAINGTQGTDHGSGGIALALGGAVAGGRVLTDWPGLAPQDRFEGRDLRTTTDVRALFKTALHQHLGLPLAALHQQVLPGSQGLPLLPILRG